MARAPLAPADMIGAIMALRHAGLQDTIARVGSDDLPLAETLAPGVTVIRQDVHKPGMLATQLLFDRHDGDASPARTHIVEKNLVVRGSGEIGPSSALAGAG